MSTFPECQEHTIEPDDDQRSLIVEVGNQLPSEFQLAPALNEIPFDPTLNDLLFVLEEDRFFLRNVRDVRKRTKSISRSSVGKETPKELPKAACAKAACVSGIRKNILLEQQHRLIPSS